MKTIRITEALRADVAAFQAAEARHQEAHNAYIASDDDSYAATKWEYDCTRDQRERWALRVADHVTQALA